MVLMQQQLVSNATSQSLKIGLMAGITIKTRWMQVKLLATSKEKIMQYKFDTTVGEGSVIVTVVMEYEQDEEGIYNENIQDVIYEKVQGLHPKDYLVKMQVLLQMVRFQVLFFQVLLLI